MDQREKTGIRVWRCNKLVGSDGKKEIWRVKRIRSLKETLEKAAESESERVER